jgi:hypothetical protein
LLKQFDVPKNKANEALSEAERALGDLADGIDLEEIETRLRIQNKGGASEDDEVDRMMDAFEGMSKDECTELSQSIQLVRLVLVKVSLRHAFLTITNHNE